MRIAVIALSEKKSEHLNRIIQAAAGEFRIMGHSCEVMAKPSTGLSGYDFLVFCSDCASMAGLKNNRLGHSLSNAGSLVGKRSMALMRTGGFFPGKKLGRFMSLLEKEGLVLTMAELVSNEAQVASLARGAPLVRG
jgi:hypothetical protein